MKLNLFYNLFRARTGLRADKKFKNQLWKKLDSSWQEKYQIRHAWFQQPAFRYATYVLTGIIIAGGGVTGTYAYSSPEVTEGTILYPIKQKIEQVEESMSRSPEAKAKFYLKQVQRREAEKEKIKFKIKQLNSISKPEKLKRIEKIDKQIDSTEDKLERVNEQLDKMEIHNPNLKPKVKEILANKVERKLERLHERQQMLDHEKDEESNIKEIDKKVKGVKNKDKNLSNKVSKVPRNKVGQMSNIVNSENNSLPGAVRWSADEAWEEED